MMRNDSFQPVVAVLYRPNRIRQEIGFADERSRVSYSIARFEQARRTYMDMLEQWSHVCADAPEPTQQWQKDGIAAVQWAVAAAGERLRVAEAELSGANAS